MDTQVNLSEVAKEFPGFIISNEDRETATKIIRKLAILRPGMIIRLEKKEFDYFKEKAIFVRFNKP